MDSIIPTIGRLENFAILLNILTLWLDQIPQQTSIYGAFIYVLWKIFAKIFTNFYLHPFTGSTNTPKDYQFPSELFKRTFFPSAKHKLSVASLVFLHRFWNIFTKSFEIWTIYHIIANIENIPRKTNEILIHFIGSEIFIRKYFLYSIGYQEITVFNFLFLTYFLSFPIVYVSYYCLFLYDFKICII